MAETAVFQGLDEFIRLTCSTFDPLCMYGIHFGDQAGGVPVHSVKACVAPPQCNKKPSQATQATPGARGAAAGHGAAGRRARTGLKYVAAALRLHFIGM